MEPIVITGASGFLGSAFLAKMLKNPEIERVYLLARRPLNLGDRYLEKQFSSAFDSQKLWEKVRVIESDLSDPASRRRGLETLQKQENGKFFLFHLAAQISENADPNFIRELNVHATRDLVEWANRRALGMAFISSVAAFGSSQKDSFRSENDFSSFEKLNERSLYCTTKREAHRTVVEECRVPYFVACPSVIHGPWDSLKDTRSRLNPFLYGNFSWVPPGGANFVSLEHVLAVLDHGFQEIRQGRSGVRLAVGANWSFKTYVESYLEMAGKARSLKILPKSLFRAVEILSAWIPAKSTSLLHGGRFFYFKSVFDSETEENTRCALAESVRTLKKPADEL
jgi:nucleoside-diphosphate-sugar epimerase